MSIKKKILLLLLIIPSVCSSQSITKKELNSLFSILENKMSAKSNNKRIEIPTEFFFIVLETDSSSNVSEVHCYSNSKLRDSSYSALTEMTKQDFTNWRPQKVRNKIIIIPVLSSAPSNGNYKDQIFFDLFWPDIRKKNTIIEKNKTIMTKILLYSVPSRIS